MVLRDDVLPALQMTVTAAADALGVSRQSLHAILAEKAAVTPAMAVRLGKLCGNGASLWLRMQQTRDLWQAERDLTKAVAIIPTLRVARGGGLTPRRGAVTRAASSTDPQDTIAEDRPHQSRA